MLSGLEIAHPSHHKHTISVRTTTVCLTVYMSTLDMDAARPALDLSRAPSSFFTMMLQSMPSKDRFTCALVCKAWAQEATAATHSITFRDRVRDLSSLQRWMEKHGGQVEVLQLYDSHGAPVLTALPCPQLKDLQLRGRFSLDSRVWSDIAAATKLTSVWLESVHIASQQADVVSALTALPDLQQLTWWQVACGRQWLTDRKLLQKLTKLTALTLRAGNVLALEHLGSLTRLQDLIIFVGVHWAAAGCPGLQELKALTRLELLHGFRDIPPSVNQLTALQQLKVPRATPTALNQLSSVTGLTCLCLRYLEDLTPESPPLQLPGLQHLKITQELNHTMPMSFLVGCTRLQVLELPSIGINLSGPGSLVASSMQQHLELEDCRLSAADGAADLVSWQQVFPGPGRLPHLTTLKMTKLQPGLQHADIECLVACCSSLQTLHLETPQDSIPSTLTNLPALTSLTLETVAMNDQQCSSLAQLTGLRELRVLCVYQVSAAGFQELATLDQLTALSFRTILYHDCDHIFFSVLRKQFPMPDQICAIINKVCGACVGARGTCWCCGLLDRPKATILAPTQQIPAYE